MIRNSCLKTIKRYKMLDGIKSVFVACSGGPDSTALLNLLTEEKRRHDWNLGVIHLNHGLRGAQSDRDEQWVKKLAKQNNLPCISGRVDVKRFAKQHRLSLEEAARELRYKFFMQQAKRYHIDCIALGHTMDDQAETVLMRLLTGSGLQGLASSRPIFSRNDVRFIRPLIQIPKSEILRFLKGKKISFRIDKSNRSAAFLRNRIRLKMIPFLEKNLGRNVKKTLSRIPETLESDLTYLESEALRNYKKLCSRKSGWNYFPRNAFAKLMPAMQFHALQQAIKDVCCSKTQNCSTKRSEQRSVELTFEHWREFQHLLLSGSEFQLQLPRRIFCCGNQTQVIVGQGKFEGTAEENQYFSCSLNLNQKKYIPEANVTVACQRLLKKPACLKKHDERYAVLDGDKLTFPLTIRNRKKGDLFQPLGQHKPSKLKDFFIHKKILRAKRDKIPLFLSDKRLIWVGGIALSEQVKVTRVTKKFTKLQIIQHK